MIFCRYRSHLSGAAKKDERQASDLQVTSWRNGANRAVLAVPFRALWPRRDLEVTS